MRPNARGQPCTYCGAYSDTSDHIVAKTLVHTDGRLLGMKTVVPACRDCNCHILKSHPLVGVDERRAFVVAKLEERLKRWPEDERLKERLAEARSLIQDGISDD